MGRVQMYRMTFGKEILCYGEIVWKCFPGSLGGRAEEAEIAGKCHSADEVREYERQLSWSSGGGQA